jgi:hypothetical protein
MCYRRASVSVASRTSRSLVVARAMWRGDTAAHQNRYRHRSSAPRLAVSVWLMALATAAGCGSDKGPTEPSDPYQGSWSGTMNDRDGGAGTLRISLSRGAPLSGIWSANLPIASPSGTVSLEPMPMTTARRSMALSCGSLGSVGLDATVNGKTMTGTYVAVGCNLSMGSISLTRP